MPRAHHPLAIALAMLFGLIGYALVRMAQVLLFPSADPATALFDAHSGYFWRIAAAGYGAGLAAPLAFWWCRERFDVAARWLGPLLAGTAALLTAQALFFP